MQSLVSQFVKGNLYSTSELLRGWRSEGGGEELMLRAQDYV